MRTDFCKNIICRICAFSVVIISVFQLSGCGNSDAIKKYNAISSEMAGSCTVAQNKNYTLSWDSSMSAVLLKDNKTGFTWSTVPYDFYLSGESNVNLSSPVFIEYYTPSDGSLQLSKAYADSIEAGTFSAITSENGITLNFGFADAEVNISVNFKLREDSLEVSIPFDMIEESGKTKLISVSLLPYMCSALNTESKNSYLFVPSGSGALMYTDEEIQNISRTFSGAVYGDDAAAIRLNRESEVSSVKIPVYGTVSGSESLMAIIESGDGSARIDAEAGNFRNGYSNVYSTVILRANDETEAERNNYADTAVYADQFDTNGTFTVGYYPLSGEKSDYNGMAARYKQYLSDSGLLKETAKRSDYHINFLGGALTKKFIFGFPYYSFTAATDFEDAGNIVKAIADETGLFPDITLTGFGKSGVDSGEIAGGLEFPSSLGGKKGFLNFEKYCNENNIGLYIDFDTVFFSSSGKGINSRFDTAKTPGKQAAAFYPFVTGTKVYDESCDKIRLLKRSEINGIADKITDFADSFRAGISLSSLSNTAYSDYSEPNYYSKGSIAEQVIEIYKKIKESGHKVSGESANAYAAAAADMLYGTPTDNGGYLNLDCSVPFYSLVFSQNVSLYSTAVNLADNREKLILKAVESGAALSFTLTDKYDSEFLDSQFTGFYGTCFKSQKGEIVDILKRCSGFYAVLDEQYVVSHEILSDTVTKTVFSAGTEVYVNYGDTEEIIGNTVLPPTDFIYYE